MIDKAAIQVLRETFLKETGETAFYPVMIGDGFRESYTEWLEARLASQPNGSEGKSAAPSCELLSDAAAFVRGFFNWLRDGNGLDWLSDDPGFEIVDILKQHGFVESVEYDPEKHGEVDADPGDKVNTFTQKFIDVCDGRAVSA